MSTSCNLDKDEEGKEVEEIKYQGMISFLFYLIASRPNIIFVVYLCAYFQANSKVSHISPIKYTMKNLTSTPLMVIDFDFTGCK